MLPPETTKIKDLQTSIFEGICEELNPKWRKFATILQEKRFKLTPREIENIARAAHNPGEWNCASTLLWKLNERGMIVRHLIRYLRQIHEYGALAYLVEEEEIQILSHPEDVYIIEGKDVRLLCQASSIPRPLYTWYKDKMIVQTEQEDPELLLKNISLSDAGKYICGVTRDGEGVTVWSHWVMVTVEPALNLMVKSPNNPVNITQAAPPLSAPHIVHQTGSRPMMDCTLNYGESMCLECLAEGNPSPDYIWLKDDIRLHDQTSPQLELSEVCGTDSGVYQCRVANSQGEANGYKINIHIMEGKEDKLAVITHPSNNSVELGTSVRLVTEGDGMNLTYQWYKDGKTIKGATQRVYQINDVALEHSGSYQCRIASHTDNGRFIKDILTMEGKLEVNIRTEKPQKAKVKIALLIGVSPEMGPDSRLKCVINDLILIREQLKKIGFNVMSFYDLTKKEMEVAIKLFATLVQEGVYALVYMAGHGFQWKGQHYFSPVDPHEGATIKDHYCCELMMATLLEKKPKLLAVFLDMCRTEFSGSKIEADMEPVYKTDEKGNLIVFYATLPFTRALEPMEHDYQELEMPLKRPNKHGILCKHLHKPLVRSLPVHRLFEEVQDSLKASSDWRNMEDQGNSAQIPSLQNNLTDMRLRLTDEMTDPYHEIEKWRRLQALPDNGLIRIYEGLALRIEFKELLSTVVKVSIIPVPSKPSVDVECKIIAHTPEELLRQQRIDNCGSFGSCGKMKGVTAIFSRLQRLTEPHVTIKVQIKVNGIDIEKEILLPKQKLLMGCVAQNFVCRNLEGRACGPKYSAVNGGQEHVDYK